jgi:transposase InsO family protein
MPTLQPARAAARATRAKSRPREPGQGGRAQQRPRWTNLSTYRFVLPTLNCYDDAPVESFFHSLKTEWVYHVTLHPRAQARSAIFEYIEGFYNLSRLHSGLGYRSPVEYETLIVTA